LRGFSDAFNLRRHLLCRHACRFNEFIQYFGASQYNSQRVFQVMSESSQQFTLERIDSPCLEPLGCDPLIDEIEFVGPLFDALFQPSVCFAQLVIERQIVKGDG
jgi:hypothetical protein